VVVAINLPLFSGGLLRKSAFFILGGPRRTGAGIFSLYHTLQLFVKQNVAQKSTIIFPKIVQVAISLKKS